MLEVLKIVGLVIIGAVVYFAIIILLITLAIKFQMTGVILGTTIALVGCLIGIYLTVTQKK
jgi:hypothetical protein